MQNNLKLENVQVTHPNNNPKPNLDYDLLTSRSIKCRILDMDYMSTNFGVDNSSYLFLERGQTDIHVQPARITGVLLRCDYLLVALTEERASRATLDR